MTERHIVVGAGPVGRATAKEASQRGHDVLLVSRSGSGPEVPGVIRASLDASDMEALVRVADGAAGLYQLHEPTLVRRLVDVLATAGPIPACGS